MNERIRAKAHNERFAKIAGVLPLKRHHELATEYPAVISVRPATSASRWGVISNAGQCLKWIENFTFVDIKKNV
jgi:hypothetical protein